MFAQGGKRFCLLTTDGQELSFAKLGHHIDALTTRLRDEGVLTGHCVVCRVDNPALRIMLRFALLRLGAEVAQISDPALMLRTGAHVDAAICFADQDAAGVRRLVFDQSWLETTPDPALVPQTPGALYATTSGSTGVPKLYKFTLTAALDMVGNTRTRFAATPGPVLVTLPDMTLFATSATLGAMLNGQGVVLMQPTIEATLRHADRLGVGEIICAPMALGELVDAVEAGAPAGNVRQILVGGAAPDLNLMRRAAAAFGAKIMIVMGASEVGLIAMLEFDAATYEPGAAGLLLDTIEARLLDQGAYLRHGPAAGRLMLRCAPAHRVEGYLGGPDAFDAEGWFETGDIATISLDRQLTILGRADNLINVGGSKFAAEVIEMLACSTHAVRQAGAVSAISGGKPAIGVLVVAGEGFDADALRLHLAAKLATSAPIHIKTCAALPCLASGKLNRRQMETMFSEG